MHVETRIARNAETRAAPAVSVVIAAWNAEAFIDTAIDSALAQEDVTLEVIVADDASGDGTAGHVAARADAEPRLTLVQNPVNGGPSAARNRAIAAARGTWIAVLDADDRYLPGRLARLVAFAEGQGADLAFDLFAEGDAAGNRIGEGIAIGAGRPERWDLARWANDNRMDGRTAGTGYLKPLMRRAFLDAHAIRYPESMRNSEDFAIVAEVLAAGGSVWLMPERGYLYTRREGSISHRIGLEHLHPIAAFDRALIARGEAALGAAGLGAMRAHLAAAEDAITLWEVIGALKDRAPGRALTRLGARPRAFGRILRWSAEAATKRIR